MKRCSRCRIKKQRSEFYNHVRSYDGLQNYCKECTRISQREFRKTHPGYNKQFYRPGKPQSVEDKARRAAYHQTRKENPLYKARRALALRVWRKKHPDRSRAYGLQKEARLRGARISEPVNRTIVFKRDNGICQLQIHPNCPVILDPAPGKWHMDHIVPISKDGEHSYVNTQATCPPCNQKKFNHYESVVA